jgi:oxaloacetate decarboxylase (Na+ extruding) subunit gamma
MSGFTATSAHDHGIMHDLIGAISASGEFMQGTIVSQGVELMLYGMGSVVIFLALLVVATTTMSRFVGRFFPEAAPVPQPIRARSSGEPAGDSARLTAVIGAAIHQYRKERK